MWSVIISADNVCLVEEGLPKRYAHNKRHTMVYMEEETSVSSDYSTNKEILNESLKIGSTKLLEMSTFQHNISLETWLLQGDTQKFRMEVLHIKKKEKEVGLSIVWTMFWQKVFKRKYLSWEKLFCMCLL